MGRAPPSLRSAARNLGAAAVACFSQQIVCNENRSKVQNPLGHDMMWKSLLVCVVLFSVWACEPHPPGDLGSGLLVVENLPQALPTPWQRAAQTLHRRGLRRRQKNTAPAPEVEPANCPAGISRYPFESTHSPITCGVANHLRGLLENRDLPHPKIFMKVGDSISASTDFLNCFETDEVNLSTSGNDSLQAAWQWYLDGQIGTTTSYARQSQATRVSQTASWVLGGDPSPLALEIEAIDPSVALVMFGTNDMYYGGHAAPASLKFPWMYSQMKRLLEDLMARGIVPILYSIPPYQGAHWQLATLVESYNVVLRGLAEGKQIPFIDYHARMRDLPGQGLRDDGVHPNTKPNSPCDFTSEGLQYGNNLRNLLTLQALDRVWQVTERNEERDHWEEMVVQGNSESGTLDNPIRTSSSHFSRFDDLRSDGENQFHGIECPGTASSISSQGNEKVFRVTFSEDTPARVMILHAKSKKMRLSWLRAPTESACVKSNPGFFQGIFPVGDHYFVVEAESPDDEDEFLFLSSRCAPADTRCLQTP